MLIYLGTRLHSHSFQETSNGANGNRGQYSLTISVSDEYEITEPREHSDSQAAHHIFLCGEAELKGYSFNGEKPENLIDEEHLAFLVQAEFKASFDVVISPSDDVESIISDDAFHQFAVALTKVGVIEKLQHTFDSTAFRHVDIRRVPVECQLVPAVCKEA